MNSLFYFFFQNGNTNCRVGPKMLGRSGWWNTGIFGPYTDGIVQGKNQFQTNLVSDFVKKKSVQCHTRTGSSLKKCIKYTPLNI